MIIQDRVSALSYSNSFDKKEYTNNTADNVSAQSDINAAKSAAASEAATVTISNSGYSRLISRIEATNNSSTDVGALMAEISSLNAQTSKYAASPAAINAINDEIFHLKLQVSDEIFSKKVLSNAADAFKANSNLNRDAVFALLQ